MSFPVPKKSHSLTYISSSINIPIDQSICIHMYTYSLTGGFVNFIFPFNVHSRSKPCRGPMLNFNFKSLIVVFTWLKLLQQSRNLQPSVHNSECKQSKNWPYAKKASTLNAWHQSQNMHNY